MNENVENFLDRFYDLMSELCDMDFADITRVYQDDEFERYIIQLAYNEYDMYTLDAAEVELINSGYLIRADECNNFSDNISFIEKITYDEFINKLDIINADKIYNFLKTL